MNPELFLRLKERRRSTDGGRIFSDIGRNISYKGCSIRTRGLTIDDRMAKICTFQNILVTSMHQFPETSELWMDRDPNLM